MTAVVSTTDSKQTLSGNATSTPQQHHSVLLCILYWQEPVLSKWYVQSAWDCFPDLVG